MSQSSDKLKERMQELIAGGMSPMAAATVCGVKHAEAKSMLGIVEEPVVKPVAEIPEGVDDFIKMLEWAEPRAVSALVTIVEDEKSPASARVSAANALLDRLHGKPAQSLNVGGQKNNPIAIEQKISLTDQEILAAYYIKQREN